MILSLLWSFYYNFAPKHFGTIQSALMISMTFTFIVHKSIQSSLQSLASLDLQILLLCNHSIYLYEWPQVICTLDHCPYSGVSVFIGNSYIFSNSVWNFFHKYPLFCVGRDPICTFSHNTMNIETKILLP